MIDNIKINIKSKCPYKLIFQYFSDKYESIDYKIQKLYYLLEKQEMEKQQQLMLFSIL